MNKVELRSLKYSIEVKDVIHLNVDFAIPVVSRRPEEVSKVLEALALLLGRGPVELVKYSPRPRCFECGSLALVNTTVCLICGANL